MRRAGILVIAALAISGPCHAKGKSSLPVKMPKFVEADNGLAAAAALRGGDYLTRVIMHFAGMDPPVTWVPRPMGSEAASTAGRSMDTLRATAFCQRAVRHS